MTSFKSYHRFKDIPHGEWSELLNDEDFFLSEGFLSIIESSHRDEIIPTYTIIKNQNNVLGIVYSQVYDFKNSKLKNYINTSKFNIITRLKSQIGRVLKVKVNFLGNIFLSNESGFKFKEGSFNKTDLEDLLKYIQKSSGTKFLLIPEHYKGLLDVNSSKIKEVNVEPDMQLEVSKDWHTFDDYLNAIRSKYKKRYRNIVSKSKIIYRRKLDSEELKKNVHHLKKLFGQVYEKSDFNSAKFNTDVLQELVKDDQAISVYGYYNQMGLVGFSSVIKKNKILYAHFVGIDYKINETHYLYAKMLFDHIEYAIENNLKLIKFGRTACEFKSNFGAEPYLGKGYVYDKTGRYLYILTPFLEMLKPKTWVQRKPFKMSKF
jgi:hypothetical protein